MNLHTQYEVNDPYTRILTFYIEIKVGDGRRRNLQKIGRILQTSVVGFIQNTHISFNDISTRDLEELSIICEAVKEARKVAALWNICAGKWIEEVAEFKGE
jgi:hypothetical protein